MMEGVPTELQEQIELFRWASINQWVYPGVDLMFAIPNGGSRAGGREGKNMQRSGVKKGVPDIFLPVACKGYYGLFIEMKRTKKGIITPAQQDWLLALKEQGYRGVVCFGAEEAKKEIVNYLS